MQTPNKFTFDILQLKNIIGSFKNKDELADFVTKSIEDLATGCKSPDVDSRILDIYNRNLNKMKVLQKTNEKYNNTTRKQLQGSAKPSTDGDTRKDSHERTPDGNIVLLESGTSVENRFAQALDSLKDKASDQGEGNTANTASGRGPEPDNLYTGDARDGDTRDGDYTLAIEELPDRTTVSDHFEARQSQNAMEDADIREDSVNIRHAPSGQTRCGTPESGTSSIANSYDQGTKQISTNAKSSTHAGTSPVRVDCETESSHSENVPACGACKQRYGAHKHVLLTVEEGAKLRKIYGNKLVAGIEILDEYIHSLPSKKNGKKNKKGAKWWREDYEAKNHYLCMIRWVYKTLNDMQTSELNRRAAENRFARSNVQPMSFAQMERERTARALRGESVDGKNYVRDEDLTPEEFMRKYG